MTIYGADVWGHSGLVDMTIYGADVWGHSGLVDMTIYGADVGKMSGAIVGVIRWFDQLGMCPCLHVWLVVFVQPVLCVGILTAVLVCAS